MTSEFDVATATRERPVTRVSPETIAAAGERLTAAHRSGRPCRPVRDLIGVDDVAAAYLVQQHFNEARARRGARVVGRKIGATSPAVQAQLGVDQPDFGVLFDDMEFGNGDLIPMARLLQPKVEAEIAFVLAEDLSDGPLDEAQLRGAIGEVMAALEIVDSRIRAWDITFGDTVADNASAGLFVLGEQRRPLSEVEPIGVAMSLTVNDRIVSTGSGAACLGDPLRAVAWLAHQARLFGEPLRAGQVILSGALGPMAAVQAGDVAAATISGLGTVTAHFGNAEDSDHSMTDKEQK